MLKSLFISVALIYCLIEYTSAACLDTTLYCFDSNENRIGEIVVGQCWKWSRLSCQPCDAEINARKITYNDYLDQCQLFFPNTAQVLNMKSVRANAIRQVLNEIAIGKKK